MSIALPAAARESFLEGTWDATGLLLDRFEEVEAVAARLPYIAGVGTDAPGRTPADSGRLSSERLVRTVAAVARRRQLEECGGRVRQLAAFRNTNRT